MRNRILRLLTISHMFPSRALPRHGVFLQRQAELLARHGIECTFLVPRPWAPTPLTRLPRWRCYGPANPLLPHSAPVHSLTYWRPPGHWFRRWEGRVLGQALVPHAARLHEEDPFHAVLACPMVPDGIAARAVKKHLGLPLATLAIGSDILVYPRRMPALEELLRSTLAQADLAVGVSQAVCGRLEELGAGHPRCVTLGRDTKRFVPGADKTALRQRLGLPGDALVAVFLGRLVASKGISELTQAVESLNRHNPRLCLLCVGDGPERAQLETLGTCCVLAGEQPPEAVSDYLQAADFLVHPSHTEGMPQAVLEAMDCGLPVVATRVGGVPEAVVDGDNGLLVDPHDAEALRVAMERMVVHHDFRHKAGQRSLALAADLFDSDRHAAQLAQAIKDLCPQGNL